MAETAIAAAFARAEDGRKAERPPDVEYLSARLELVESGNGEDRRLEVSPLFDRPRIEIGFLPYIDGDTEAFVSLNRRQIECLSDFLIAWLARAKREDGDG